MNKLLEKAAKGQQTYMSIFCLTHAYGDILPALGLRYGRGFLFSAINLISC